MSRTLILRVLRLRRVEHPLGTRSEPRYRQREGGRAAYGIHDAAEAHDYSVREGLVPLRSVKKKRWWQRRRKHGH